MLEYAKAVCREEKKMKQKNQHVPEYGGKTAKTT